MNPCIKTGGLCYFVNYDAILSADIFKVGNTYVVRTHADQLSHCNGNYKGEPYFAMIEATTYGEEFWRPDIGVFVVNADAITFAKG